MSQQVSVQGPAVRSVFERYDSGLYSPDKVVLALQGLGLKTPQNFVDLINQFSRSRNLPYREFLKALTSESVEFKSEGLSVETIRQVNLRNAPISAASKAPYDTITELSDSATNTHRQKRYLAPAAHLQSHEEEIQVGFKKTSDAVFDKTVDVFDGVDKMAGDQPREVDERKLKLIAGHGDIITWTGPVSQDETSSAGAVPVADRRIADVQGDKKLLEWCDENPMSPSPHPVRSPRINILAFDENCDRNRPGTAAKTSIKYPFATETDDLVAARAGFHKQRIHKMTASSATHK